MTSRERAQELFLQGYNCAQAVAGAFCDEMGMTLESTVRALSGFGGGMGRLREVCGACSGMTFVLSNLKGYDKAEDQEGKKAIYEIVRKGMEIFKEKNGSYICRELLDDAPVGGDPAQRTGKYYEKRPCVELVGDAAEICEQLLK